MGAVLDHFGLLGGPRSDRLIYPACWAWRSFLWESG
jgi:hypothetical protein